MIHQRRPPKIGSLKRRFPKWESASKSISYFLFATTILFIFLASPFLYYSNQNFEFFKTLALEKSPTLLSHIEREQIWFNILTFVLLTSLCLTNWYFATRFVRNFRGQVQSFDRHLKHLIRGEWYTPALRVRHNDDFKDLVEQYGYFYRSLQAMTKAEIQLLEKMNIDPSQRENYIVWKTLIQQKKSRLGNDEIIIENSIAIESSNYWKRVS